MELLALAGSSGEEDGALVLRYGDGTLYRFTKTKETIGAAGTDPADDGGEENDGSEGSGESVSYISSMGKYVTLTKESCEQAVSLPVMKIGTAAEEEKETITVASEYTVKEKDGNEYRFDGMGRLVLITETNGNFVIPQYDQKTGLLSKVRTNRNLCIELSYNDGENGADPLTIKEVDLFTIMRAMPVQMT